MRPSGRSEAFTRRACLGPVISCENSGLLLLSFMRLKPHRVKCHIAFAAVHGHNLWTRKNLQGDPYEN